MTQHWLIKSEPSDYSIDDLARDGKSAWTGVRNYQARNFMRDQMQIGDTVLFYHSSTEPPGVVGVGKVVSKPYPDPTAFDASSPYYDPKSTTGAPVWILVDIGFVEKLPRQITLNEIKSHPLLSQMRVAQKGSRLSVQPVTKAEFTEVLRLAKA